MICGQKVYFFNLRGSCSSDRANSRYIRPHKAPYFTSISHSPISKHLRSPPVPPVQVLLLRYCLIYLVSLSHCCPPPHSPILPSTQYFSCHHSMLHWRCWISYLLRCEMGSQASGWPCQRSLCPSHLTAKHFGYKYSTSASQLTTRNNFTNPKNTKSQETPGSPSILFSSPV